SVPKTITVTINPLPNATISGTTTICAGSSATINFTGPSKGTINYTRNGIAQAALTLNTAGTGSVNSPTAEGNYVYIITSVTSVAADGGCTHSYTSNQPT